MALRGGASHLSISAIPPGASRQGRLAPSTRRLMSPASSNTRRCREIAGWLMANGCAAPNNSGYNPSFVATVADLVTMVKIAGPRHVARRTAKWNSAGWVLAAAMRLGNHRYAAAGSPTFR